ncbi:MAG: type II toxin-antitoxin system HicB family antitoxin [Alphaproteobacteria bacterium]|nr:type II toxin-antitoxin system HicB family antitoxin [Alphaproteobacteria bacterium]
MRETHYVYPAIFKRDSAGRIFVAFPDLPEALTDGATEAEAMSEAADCLSEALMNRILHDEAVPYPSAIGRRHRAVAPDPTVALKAALHRVAAERHVTAAEMARRLDIDHKDARRLLDPRHKSKLPRLAAALDALGCGVSVVVAERA